jgi:type II secretory pathway component GspD/PulD (secretin)
MTLKQTRRLACMAFALTLLSFGLSAHAQDQPDKPSTEDQTSSKPLDHCAAIRGSATESRTFYLTNVSQQNDANEILVALRNMLCPGTKTYLVTNQNALVMQAPPDQLAAAQKIINDLDRPRKTYRLIYTITELDAGKTIGTQHFSMVIVSGQHTSIKQGDKVPVATGSYSNGDATSDKTAGVQTQFTYLDVGMNFDATLDEVANGARLLSKVEQSSLGAPTTIAGVQEPVVRQTVLQGTSFLSFDKPLMLGSIDIPNSTRHFDIAVVLEQVK